ncbi:MAG: UPF0164 family protein [Elusimicrobiota bacterium]
MTGCAFTALSVPSIFLFVAVAFASGGAGTSVAPVFKLPAGARPAGMGNTFVSVADDANSGAWNPAGLSRVPRKSVSFMHQQLFESVNYEYLAYAQPVGRGGGLGAHLAYVFTDPIERTYEDAGGSFDPNRSGGTFQDSDMKLNLSGAYSPWQWVALGAGANFLQDKVDKDSASGFMGDLGLLAVPMPGISLGAALLNWGPPLRGGSRPPALLRLGGHWLGWPGGLAAAEYDYSFDSDRRTYSLGVEHWFAGTAALRAGYQWGERKDAGGYRYSMGLGWRFRTLQFDYAFSPMGELGHTHRAGLTFSFGADRDGAAGEDRVSSEDVPEPGAPARRESAAEDRIRQASELIESELYIEASRELKAARRLLNPEDEAMVRVHTLNGKILLHEGSAEEAKLEFIKAGGLAKRRDISGPDLAEAYAGLGAALLKQGKPAQAERVFKKALEAGPSSMTKRLVEAELERLKPAQP